MMEHGWGRRETWEGAKMGMLPSQTDMGRICRKGSAHGGLLA